MDAFLDMALRPVAPGALIAFLDNRNVDGSSTTVSRHGWGAHVDLLQHYWLLTWRAPA